ncbi:MULTISPECIES: ExbD/TolR family protein [Henriciella]|jgi:biopolymer transport protein TolR|uniref:Protein TolR n=1 Tax=Henriciella pelagia TaxID=1977912 RepID=A0ABQ1JS73_9PROT|nr:biopolymer transporter ExbD [Henriciella pelagia]GGB73267.1 protein TolR [Henriciella pelagia]
MAGGWAAGPSGGKRGRRGLAAEINVTPFVDVMLVLLIVFMITAPLLTTGVEVSLPKASAENLAAPKSQPLSVTLNSSGEMFIQDTKVSPEDLVSTLYAIAGEGYEERIYLRADDGVNYGAVMEVMTRMQRAGYRNIALVTDPKAQGQQ